MWGGKTTSEDIFVSRPCSQFVFLSQTHAWSQPLQWTHGTQRGVIEVTLKFTKTRLLADLFKSMLSKVQLQVHGEVISWTKQAIKTTIYYDALFDMLFKVSHTYFICLFPSSYVHIWPTLALKIPHLQQTACISYKWLIYRLMST